MQHLLRKQAKIIFGFGSKACLLESAICAPTHDAAIAEEAGKGLIRSWGDAQHVLEARPYYTQIDSKAGGRGNQDGKANPKFAPEQPLARCTTQSKCSRGADGAHNQDSKGEDLGPRLLRLPV